MAVDTLARTLAAGMAQTANDLSEAMDTIEEEWRIAKAQVGTPLVAATAAAMTDHDKIYVYTGSETGYTAGNWYYWNGSAWASGGVYNSTALNTDKTLSISDMAADAKVTGDEITDVKNALAQNVTTADNLYNASEKSYGTILTPTTTDGLYINASGVFASASNAHIEKYQVEKGKIYRCVSPNYSAPGNYVGIAFSVSGTVSAGLGVDVIVQTVTTTNIKYDKYFSAYADGYLLVSRFNGRGFMYVCEVDVETIRGAEPWAEIENSIDSGYVLLNGTQTTGYYVNSTGDIVAQSGISLTSYKVYKGKKYRFTATGYYLASTYDAISFSRTGLIVAGYKCEEIIYQAKTSAEDIDLEYTATEDGYVFTIDYSGRVISVSSYDLLPVAMESSLPVFQELLPAYATYTGRYMNDARKVVSYSNATIKVYSATKGKKYTFVSLSVSTPSAAYTVIGFDSTSSPDVNDICETAIHNPGTSNAYDLFEYIPKKDGYFWVTQFNGRGAYSVYESQIEDCLDVSDTLPVFGDVVAILGDSIMQNMATDSNALSGNVQTYQYNGNPYNYADLTNENGHLYYDGHECTVVNSLQTDLDDQNWDALKKLIGAEKIINASVGGSTINETEVITSYPGNENDTNRTLSLPNLVRWLKRLTDGGEPIPNCIVIWMGTNNITGTDGDFDTIMGLSWSTLSDDATGRTYRATTYGGLRFALETLYRNYPDATVFVIGPIQSATTNRTYDRIAARNAVMQKMADRYSAIYIDAASTIGIVDLYESNGSSGRWLRDGLHPNENGKQLYANYLAKRLNGLYFNKSKLI